MKACMTLAALGLLVGCAETEADGLQVWMKNERARHQPQVETAPTLPDDAAVDVPAQVTVHRQVIEPFSRLRLLRSAPIEGAAPAKTSQLTAKTSRSTPPLEASPLAGMRLVGSLQRGGQSWALLRVNGLVYSVRVGDRLGQDRGRVTAITLSGLELREITHDSAGQPTERVVGLALVSEP